MPFFSIVTITLNNKKGLQKTFDSLDKQTFRDFEWLVVDGKSEDGTDKWIHAHESYITWHQSRKDKGLYDAMNIGLDHSRGDYVLFLNAGDTLADEYTLARVEYAIRSNDNIDPDFVYGDAWEEMQDGSVGLKLSAGHEKMNYGLFTHHQSMYYRRLAIGDMRYNLDYKIAADFDFTVRFLKRVTGSIVYIDKPLCIFENGGISQTKADLGRREFFAIRKKELNIPAPINWLFNAFQWGMTRLRERYPRLYFAIRFHHGD